MNNTDLNSMVTINGCYNNIQIKAYKFEIKITYNYQLIVQWILNLAWKRLRQHRHVLWYESNTLFTH